jgi:hypothetical protein
MASGSMPIDVRRGIVFIHIPKTGGTSIEHMLGLMQPQSLYGRSEDGSGRSDKTLQHLTWAELHAHADSRFLSGALKFAFVRNPWDRFLSEYLWRRSWYFRDIQSRSDYFYSAQDLKSLDAFVRVLNLPQPKRVEARRGFDGHLESQLSFVIDVNAEVAMNFVGRFENFASDVHRVCRLIGMEPPPIVHLCRTRRDRHYRDYYSSYARRAVESFYKDDIRQFGYEF